MSLIVSHLVTVILGVGSLLVSLAAGLDCAAWLFVPILVLVAVNLTRTRGRHGHS